MFFTDRNVFFSFMHKVCLRTFQYLQ